MIETNWYRLVASSGWGVFEVRAVPRRHRPRDPATDRGLKLMGVVPVAIATTWNGSATAAAVPPGVT